MPEPDPVGSAPSPANVTAGEAPVATSPPPTSSQDGAGAAAPLSGVPTANLRSLGGIRVNGGTVAPGLVWRSDNLTISPDDQVAALREQGVRTVIDLRAPDEVRMTGVAVLDRHRIRHVHRPMTRRSADPATLAATFDSIRDHTGVGEWYLRLARARAAVLLASLQDIAEAEDGIVFYCTAGKDRTGVLAAVLLLLLGAEDEEIIEDYARTGAVVDLVNRRHAAVTGRPLASAKFPGHPILNAHPDSMATFLRGIRADGGVERFLGAQAQARDGDAAGVQMLSRRLTNRLLIPG